MTTKGEGKMVKDTAEGPDNINELESDDLYQRAKELVPNIDELIKKGMDSGKYLTVQEAAHAIAYANSREKVGTQLLDGFWIAYVKSKKGKQMAYVLDKENGTKTVFFEHSLKHPPKRFDPVRVKVNIVRNALNPDTTQAESLEFIKVKPGHLKLPDMMDFIASPGSITEKRTFLIAGKIRYVNNIVYDKGQKLPNPKPLFERAPDGKRSCNVRIAVSDFSNENSMCNVTLKKIEHLAAIIGVKPLKLIDHFKKISNEDEKLQKLRNNMIPKRLLILGFGDNKNPSTGEPARSPYLSPGDFGFIMSYDKVFAGVKEHIKEQEDKLETEIEQAEKPMKLNLAQKARIGHMIKAGKATKKSLKFYAKKHKVDPAAISIFISDLIDKGEAKQKGDRILPK
jgi:hypothetical protein